MNLVDLVDDKGIQQDEWSLTAPKFGSEGQLTVVGWSGRIKNGAKIYILKCGVCVSDTGLFGDGYFKSLKDNLLKSKIPCGCAKASQWSKNQYGVLCSRKADELGYVFLGFEGDWKAARTKLKLFCKDHGEWKSLSMNHFLHTGVGCPSCKGGIQKTDELMVTSFLATGAFHPDTKFWRSERKTSIGTKPYWYMYCPVCTETAEALSGGFQRGGYPCACSKHHQKEAYINLVMDGENCIAIKFGIANNSFQRLKSQNRRSVYQISNHLIYKFPNIDSCRSAEKECKDVLVCGVVSRTDVPDGHTETTYIYNLERVVEIYEKYGGVVCHSH